MRRLARILVAGVVVGCGCGLAQQGKVASGPGDTPVSPAPAVEPTIVATPAMWRVKGAHGTAYLFGSVHVMKPNVEWETAKVKAALDGSDVLYLEIANIDDTASAQPIVMQMGIDMAHPLSTKISKDDEALLDTAAKSMGLPGAQTLEPMQPWLVSVALSTLPLAKAGFDPKSGIDLKLLAQAKDQQKSVKGFETMAEQMHMLADVPQDQQVKMLHKDLVELDKSAAQTIDMVEAWEHGDVEKIGKIDNDELAVKYPEEYKRVLVDRNTKWVATLDGLLKDPATGTVFIAVGAAHLAGPDSVLKMLEKDGWKVERQ